MIKMVCDRCGKEILMSVLVHNNKITMISGFHRTEYDLCRDCFFKVQNFILESQISVDAPIHCGRCENAQTSECTICDGEEYFVDDHSDKTDCAWGEPCGR